MVLFNVYDNQTEQYICEPMTAKQIGSLLNVAVNHIYTYAKTGSQLNKRYTVESHKSWYSDEGTDLLDEWDKVTQKARAWFDYMRRSRR